VFVCAVAKDHTSKRWAGARGAAEGSRAVKNLFRAKDALHM
jgi:hypothetical protein